MKTNLDAVWACGDITTFDGKLKLIATGFGEAAIAIAQAIHHIRPDMRIQPADSSTLGGPGVTAGQPVGAVRPRDERLGGRVRQETEACRRLCRGLFLSQRISNERSSPLQRPSATRPRSVQVCVAKTRRSVGAADDVDDDAVRARTKKRRRPQGSSVSGWTIS